MTVHDRVAVAIHLEHLDGAAVAVQDHDSVAVDLPPDDGLTLGIHEDVCSVSNEFRVRVAVLIR